MPLYEYRCDACGQQFERIQKFSDPPVEVCPSCGERQVQKLLSSPAIQFKGSGWYITDYARKGTDAKDAAAKNNGKEGKAAESDAKPGAESKGAASDASGSSGTTTTPPASPAKQ